MKSSLNAVFDLRNPEHRERIADALPTIDEIQYSISREQFLDALAALIDHLPVGLSLEYRYGHISIHATGSTVFSLVDLGQSLRTLQDCDGFEVFLRGFHNPTQFWDTYFEARVATYFRRLPSVHALQFSPGVVARGRQKYPEFLLTTVVGNLLVECKRLHVTASKAYAKFQSDVQTIETTMTQSAWPAEYCLEVEFLGPEREQMSSLARKIITAGLDIVPNGGGEYMVGNLNAIVRHRDQPFQMNVHRPGVHMGVIRLPGGFAVQITDPRYTTLRAFRGDIGRKYLKLLRATINDARSQLPADQPAAICVGDLPLRVARELFEPQLAEFNLPPNIRLLMFWDGINAKPYAREEEWGFVQQLLGTTILAELG